MIKEEPNERPLASDLLLRLWETDTFETFLRCFEEDNPQLVDMVRLEKSQVEALWKMLDPKKSLKTLFNLCLFLYTCKHGWYLTEIKLELELEDLTDTFYSISKTLMKFRETFIPIMDGKRWSEAAEGFNECWNYPRAVGALCSSYAHLLDIVQKRFVHWSLFVLVDAYGQILDFEICYDKSSTLTDPFETKMLPRLREASKTDFPKEEPIPGFGPDAHAFRILVPRHIPLFDVAMKMFADCEEEHARLTFNQRFARFSFNVVALSRFSAWIIAERFCRSFEEFFLTPLPYAMKVEHAKMIVESQLVCSNSKLRFIETLIIGSLGNYTQNSEQGTTWCLVSINMQRGLSLNVQIRGLECGFQGTECARSSGWRVRKAISASFSSFDWQIVLLEWAVFLCVVHVSFKPNRINTTRSFCPGKIDRPGTKTIPPWYLTSR